jgi:hypothetical protein
LPGRSSTAWNSCSGTDRLPGEGSGRAAAEHEEVIMIVTRREAIRGGLVGAAGLVLTDGLGRVLGAARPTALAKSVIQIWMWGGPSHLDTFDPKPEAGYDYCGALGAPIRTNVDGIVIGELLPELAKHADKYSIVRGMTHGINAHETASYAVQTGRRSGDRQVYPTVGAVVSLFRGYDAGYAGLLPPYIVLTELQGRFDEAGFLGPRYRPFATGGDPGQARFVVEGVVAQTLSADRQRARRELRRQLDTLGPMTQANASVEAFVRSDAQAYDLILGEAGKVFDLSEEANEIRDRYGRNTFGQSCLVARRLVERGVPYITINYKGWDTHRQNFQIMRQRLPQMDRGMAALLEDLASRGLLDRTIVWWSGEFGRTPRVQWEAPWNGGRGHWGQVFSAVVAGGGFRGGRVVGASDARGEEVRERPVTPVELIGSVYELVGLDTDAALPHPQGLDVRMMPPAEGPTPRRLREIM